MAKGNPNPELHIENLQPQEAAITHGVTRWQSRCLAPPCKKCLEKSRCPDYEEGATCRAAEKYKGEVVSKLMALPQIEAEDAPLIHEFAQLVVGLQIVDHWIANVGPFTTDKQGHQDLQPVFSRRLAISNSMARLADRLGLTPLARKSLSDSGGAPSPLATAIIEVAAKEGGADEG